MLKLSTLRNHPRLLFYHCRCVYARRCHPTSVENQTTDETKTDIGCSFRDGDIRHRLCDFNQGLLLGAQPYLLRLYELVLPRSYRGHPGH